MQILGFQLLWIRTLGILLRAGAYTAKNTILRAWLILCWDGEIRKRVWDNLSLEVMATHYSYNVPDLPKYALFMITHHFNVCFSPCTTHWIQYTNSSGVRHSQYSNSMILIYCVGLQELCSKFPSKFPWLFYSKSLSKPLHYAQFILLYCFLYHYSLYLQ